jgi:phosphoribosylanthranilate isomerase
MIEVKICGLTRPNDAAHAERCGATFLGAILAGGPRLLTSEQAAAVLGPRRIGVRRVGVFGDQSESSLLEQSRRLDLDVLQLHGARTPDAVARLATTSGRVVWPVVRVAGDTLPDETMALAQAAGALVLDALVLGQPGGTGVALDWSGLRDAVAGLRAELPTLQLILAGGLRPSNVQNAIGLLRPDVVDVSSGVEMAPGVKDPALVHQFVQAAQAAAEQGQ